MTPYFPIVGLVACGIGNMYVSSGYVLPTWPHCLTVVIPTITANCAPGRGGALVIMTYRALPLVGALQRAYNKSREGDEVKFAV